jgi:hypothetical protein
MSRNAQTLTWDSYIMMYDDSIDDDMADEINDLLSRQDNIFL